MIDQYGSIVNTPNIFCLNHCARKGQAKGTGLCWRKAAKSLAEQMEGKICFAENQTSFSIPKSGTLHRVVKKNLNRKHSRGAKK